MLSTLAAVTLLLPQQQDVAQEVHVRALVQGPPGFTAVLESQGYQAPIVRSGITGDGAGFEIVEVIELESVIDALRRRYPSYPTLAVERARPFREIVGQWQAAVGVDTPDPAYKTPAEIATELLLMEQTYPTIAKRYDLMARHGVGLTHMGNRIYGLRISDNPTLDEDEPAILLVANHHARELNTIEVPLDVAARLLQGYGNDPWATQLVDDNAVWIVPTMNPDGLDHVWNVDQFWRKNRRDNGNGTFGVDQNRNYPYFWSQCGSSGNTGSSTYHGPAAASEPETRMMLAFGRAEHFERVWDQHSHGRDVRWPHNPLTAPNIPAPVGAVVEPVRAQVAALMGYGLTNSCCCGGQQHWHFAEYGALAYLSEMGTSFQPPFTSTVSELSRMWPGLREFLSTSVPLTGHVTSLEGGVPLQAVITLPGAPFVDGQRRESEARFGRYAVWLGPGTFDLRFAAPGHDPETVRVTIAAGRTTLRDVVLVPTMRPTTLSASGPLRVGQGTNLLLHSPDDPMRDYLMLASSSSTPPLAVGPRTIPLANDFLLASVLSSPQVFVNFLGRLDANGRATGTAVVPNIPALAGFPVHFAAVTLAPGWPMRVKGISNGLRLVIN